ncbi:hypothetical protein RyT2_19210 [Pseudolactococcus yaeyamensis]
MSNFQEMKFAYLTEKFYAVAYDQTGSNEFMNKMNRPYLGVIDSSGWLSHYVPMSMLRHQVRPTILPLLKLITLILKTQVLIFKKLCF